MTTEKKQTVAVQGLLKWELGEPRLIGGKCKSCGAIFFPKSSPAHKSNCMEREVEEVLLSRRGTIDSYTVQHYPPPPPFVKPDPYIPYGIGLVALPEGINVLGILTGIETGDIKTKIDVELVAEKLYEDKEGNEMLTWKFRPVKA